LATTDNQLYSYLLYTLNQLVNSTTLKRILTHEPVPTHYISQAISIDLMIIVLIQQVEHYYICETSLALLYS